jgi:hypothetical protein
MPRIFVFPALEQVTKPNLTTAEAAHYMNLAEQTLRLHACRQTGPVRPVRYCNTLHWPTEAVRKLVTGGAQ